MPLFGFFKPNVKKLKASRDLEGLAKALGSGDEKVAQAAGEVLADFGGAEVVELLLTTLKEHPTEGARFHAARLLGETIAGLDDEALRSRVVEVLIVALCDESVIVRVNTTMALGKIGDSRAVPALVALLMVEEHLMLRFTTVQALRDVGDPEAVPVFAATMGNTHELPATRELAKEALLALGPLAVPGLIEFLTHDNQEIRLQVVDVLGQIGDARAVEPLTAIANDNSREVRQAVAGALSKLRVESAAAGMKTFFHEEWNFSITYPADWEIIYQDEPAGSWTIPIAVAGADTGSGRPCFMVNARRGEILQGSSTSPVFVVGPDGTPVKMPGTPREYIEMNRESLRHGFPGFQFISAEEIRLAHKPAAKLVYSYSGQKGRITEESITLFGVGVTFQFICEVPSAQYAEFQPRFQSILESFRIGREMPEEAVAAKSDSEEAPAKQSPVQIYNRGVRYYRNGDFGEALAAFDQCFHSGEYQMQAGYARALCQQELGLEVEIPEELGDNAEAAGPVYVATNLVCHLIGEGHQAALTKQGKTSDAQADISGARYRISIVAGFGFGGFFKNAWRKEGEKYIPLTDSSANPNPTEADRFVISLVERASSLPPSSLPEGGLRTSLEQVVLPVPDGEQQQAEAAQPVDSSGQPATPGHEAEAEGELKKTIADDGSEPADQAAVKALHTLDVEPAVEDTSTEYPSYAQAPPAVPSQTSPLAVVSLVAGIAGWIILPLVGAIAAVITGHLAHKEIRHSKGGLSGRWLAIAGLVLGYGQFAAAALVVMLVLAVMLFGQVEETTARPTLAVPVVQVVATATVDASQATAIAQWMQAGATATVQAMQAEVTAQEAIRATAVATGSGWPLVLLDTFDSNAHNWPSGSSSNELVTATESFINGKYHWDVKAHQDVHLAARLVDTSAVFDFYLCAEAQRISGPDDGSYGVEFRVHDANSKYYFGIYNSRHFAFSLLHGGQWTRLVDLTPTSAIRAGEANRITVVAQGTHFAFFINDQFVAEADDDRLDSGTVGLAIELSKAGDEAVFEFDNFELRAPPAPTPQAVLTTPTPALPLASPVPEGVIAFVSDRDGNFEIYVMAADWERCTAVDEQQRSGLVACLVTRRQPGSVRLVSRRQLGDLCDAGGWEQCAPLDGQQRR